MMGSVQVTVMEYLLSVIKTPIALASKVSKECTKQ